MKDHVFLVTDLSFLLVNQWFLTVRHASPGDHQ